MSEDKFDQYLTEKIWGMIPEIYRHEDGQGNHAGTLRAIVEVLAKQAATLRRSHDRLWEDQFIELCNQWSVPYIGELVATRLVSALDVRSRRTDVAKTIYYRRRAGTLKILEELISDMADWEGKVVEAYRRLSRSRHSIEPPSIRYKGRYTGTLPGGVPDLRTLHANELVNGPFSEFHHVPDARTPRCKLGVHNLERLVFYIYRLKAYSIRGVRPASISGTNGLGFRFDPSNRDVQLFMPRNRPQDPENNSSNNSDWGKWRSSFEWEIPAPMRCRLFNHSEFRILEEHIDQLEDGSLPVLTQTQADDLRRYRGIHFKSIRCFRDALDRLTTTDFLDTNRFLPIVALSLLEQTGKYQLYPNALTVSESNVEIDRENAVAACLCDMTVAPVDQRVVIDPERGRLLFIGNVPGNVEVDYHIGFPGPVGAGSWQRSHVEPIVPDVNHSNGVITGGQFNANGIDQINDSTSYLALPDVSDIINFTLVAANEQRPYLLTENDWLLDSGVQEAMIEIDGIWLGSENDAEIIVSDEFEEIKLSFCTIDPGGERTEISLNDLVPHVSIVIEGHVEKLIITSSITGSISVRNDGTLEELVVKDSIIQAPTVGDSALNLPDTKLNIKRSTIVGELIANCVYVEDSVLYGLADVANTQCGCFRYSAVFRNSRVPKPYESYFLDVNTFIFTSMRFGNQAYFQLNTTAPKEITHGAYNGSEMGVYNQLLNPMKFHSLRAKVEEFKPYSLLPVYVFQN